MNYRLIKWLGRRGLRRSNLRGSWLHRVAGNRLFAPDLWRFNRHSVRNGWIIGAFAASNPFLGVQILAALPFAIWFRANLLVVVALVFVTNPLTIVPFLATAYSIAAPLTGGARTEDGGKLAAEFNRLGVMEIIADWHVVRGAVFTTLLGCLIIGSVAALVGALLIHFLWRDQVHRPGGRLLGGWRRPAPMAGAAAAPSEVSPAAAVETASRDRLP